MDKSKLLRATLTAHLRKYNPSHAEMLADYMVTLLENGKADNMHAELETFVGYSDAREIMEWLHSEQIRLGFLPFPNNNNNTISSNTNGEGDARNIIKARNYSHLKYETEDGEEEEVRPSRGLEELTMEDMQPLRHKPVKCPYLPNCRASPGTCAYYHPTENCRYFPNCQYGSACLYYHPPQPCRFQDKCKNPNCNYLHTTVYGSTTFKMCRYGDKCRNENCAFAHSNGQPCRFGGMCTNVGCPFEHPADRLMERQVRYSKINVQCRFGKRCAKADCPFVHMNEEEPLAPQAVNNKWYHRDSVTKIWFIFSQGALLSKVLLQPFCASIHTRIDERVLALPFPAF